VHLTDALLPVPALSPAVPAVLSLPSEANEEERVAVDVGRVDGIAVLPVGSQLKGEPASQARRGEESRFQFAES